jgi:hypothetical protein
MRRLRPICAIAVVSVLAIAPALIHGQPFTDSGVYDQVWAGQFAEGLARGELYPRWLPRSFGRFGAPTFWFYPPAVYYLTSLIRFLGASVEQSVTLAEGAICFLSGKVAEHALDGVRAGARTEFQHLIEVYKTHEGSSVVAGSAVSTRWTAAAAKSGSLGARREIANLLRALIQSPWWGGHESAGGPGWGSDGARTSVWRDA